MVDGPDASSSDGQVSLTLDDRDVQDDSRRISWSGTGVLSVEGAPVALGENSILQISYMVTGRGEGPVSFAMACGEGCEGSIDVTAGIRWAESKDWQNAELPLSCFAEAGADLSAITAPLVISGSPGLEIWLDDVTVAGEASDDMACEL